MLSFFSSKYYRPYNNRTEPDNNHLKFNRKLLNDTKANKGFQNQYEGNWQVLRPDSVMVGRVVTAQYMPLRPDVDSLIRKQGKKESRIGSPNSWPIDVLKEGDIYVADSYEKIVDGTLIGDNLGNSIYAHSHKGVIFYGSVRDVEGLEEINGFNAWI